MEAQPGLAAFSQWTQRYLAASPSQRTVLEAEGLTLAQERRKDFLALITTDPREALAETVPSTLRQQLPPDIREQLEQTVSGKGDLDVLATVPPQGRPEEAPASLRQAVLRGERYTAHVYGERKSQRTSSNISLHGVALDRQLALSDSALRVLEPGEIPPADLKKSEPFCSVSGQPAVGPDTVLAASGDQLHWLCRGGHLEVLEKSIRAAEGGTNSAPGSLAPTSRAYATLGNRSILVMLVDFADAPGGPVSISTAQTSLADVAGFMRSNSFNQFNFATQDVTPVLRMPRASSFYATNQDAYTLLQDARQSATAAGFNDSGYDFDIVAFANIGFPWGGLGYVGAKGSWVQGDFHRGVTAHELGHNFGNWHANAWISSSVIGADGTHREYGNPFDVLGNAWNYSYNNHYNANFKFLNGWLSESQLHTVTASGVYRIFAQDQGGTLKQARRYAIRIPVGIRVGDETMDYWIDFRQGYAGNDATANGAVLKWGNDSGTISASRLLDTHPDAYGNMEDAPLLVGETFRDRLRLVSITTLAKGRSGGDPYLDIQINFIALTLQESLDLPEATWATGGAKSWVAQTESTHDGGHAAASGPIGDEQESYLETAITGPGTLSFWWMVSSEADYDFLSFLMDGQELDSMSGEQPWQERAWPVPAGTHTLRWRYRKDASVALGNDRGYVDQVAFTAETPLTNDVPVIGLAGTNGSQRAFGIIVPPGQGQLIISISGGTGDSDLYVRQGRPATLLEWDYRPYIGGNDETVLVLDPAPGPWHILLHGYADYHDVQILARYGTGLPIVTVDPQSVVAAAPTAAQFSVEVSSPTPVTYQWRRNGVNLVDNGSVTGVTTSTLLLQPTTRAQAGVYSVLVANEHGQSLSRSARLRVIAPTVLHPPARLTDGTVRLQFADAGGTPFTDPAAANYFVVLASTNLVDWVSLDRGVTVTNGVLEVVDPESAFLPYRFYQTVEY